jgi:hypothetical protein
MNNLTTPPPVEELDPQYAEDLRAQLVRNARGTRGQWSLWTPILAAACGVAVITGGVVASTRTGGNSGSLDPAGPQPTVAQQVPANASERINLDRGSTSTNDYGIVDAAAARKCFAEKKSALGQPNPAIPADVTLNGSYQASLQKALPGEGGLLEPLKTTLLIQEFTTAAGVVVRCYDGKLLYAFDPAAGVSRESSLKLSKSKPVNGLWSFSEIPEGNSSRLFVSYTFAALPGTQQVEIRIRWTGGASPWYVVPAYWGSGYVTASQAGAVHRPGLTEVDYRALGKDGEVLFSGVEQG